MELKQLNAHRLSVALSFKAGGIYQAFNWKTQRVIGDQFIRAVDSIGANIAEGFGRFHYLDKCKFYYNARGSLFETGHWLLLLYKRTIISKEVFNEFKNALKNIHKALNGLIKGTKNQIKS